MQDTKELGAKLISYQYKNTHAPYIKNNFLYVIQIKNYLFKCIVSNSN